MLFLLFAVSFALALDDNVQIIRFGECIDLDLGSPVFVGSEFLGVSPMKSVCFAPGKHVLNGGQKIVFVKQPDRRVETVMDSVWELERKSFVPSTSGIGFYQQNIPFDLLKLANPSMLIQALWNPSQLMAAVGNGALSAGVAGDGTLTSLHWPSPTAFDHLELFASKDGRQQVLCFVLGFKRSDEQETIR